jgi:hypothetical protein
MKRSEMVKFLAIQLRIGYGLSESERKADLLLRMVEELGMLPPPASRDKDGNAVGICAWEAE